MDAALTREAYIHMKHPHGVDGISAEDAVGRCGQEGQGPFFVVGIQVVDGKVQHAGFRCLPCAWSTAVGSALTQMIEGQPVEWATQVSPTEIERALSGVPRAKRELPGLAVGALRAALAGVSRGQ